MSATQDAAEESKAEEPADAAPAEEKPADGTAAEPSDPATEEPAAEETPATEEAKDEPAETPEKPADEKASEEKPAEAMPAEEQPSDEKPAGASAADAVVPRPDVPDEAAQFEPLEKVQDTIRGTLAREKAIERITDQFDELSAKMRSYAADYDRYTVEKGTDARAKSPAPLNFAELAEGKDVQPLELKSVSAVQVTKEDIGKSFRTIQSVRGAQSVPFVNFAYSDTVPEFRPEMTQDNENNVYLFWRTQLERPYVPPLDQIRDPVVRAWKMIKARELASRRGKEYAEQSQSLHKSLAELFGSQGTLKVTETQPFSWLTFGNVPVQPGVRPRLSEVEGVDLAGPAFMKTVFGLHPDGVGVAINEPQDTVYVVRLVEFEPSLGELRDAFAGEQPSRYLAAAFDEQRQVFETWIKDLNAEADVHWIRQADVRRDSEDEEL